MDIVTNIRNAGVVGAGGAGFPTHVKMSGKAEWVIANGAECEPLLRVDQQLMTVFADELIAGLIFAMEAVGASKGVIALKDHYKDAIDVLRRQIENVPGISLYIMLSYYPAGDEQQIVYEVTGSVVPTGGIPLDVGVVISNVNTLINIARAQHSVPVTEKYVTVGGAVKTPVTVNAPIGISLRELIEHAGGVTEECGYIIGGPCMGRVEWGLDHPVTKTTGGILAIPKDHPLFHLKSPEMNLQMVKAVCCQCTMCSQMCPRNSLGLNVQPHKAMRSLAQGTDLMGDFGGVFSCCDCGICTYYACNFGLKPSTVMSALKQQLSEGGSRPEKKPPLPVDSALDTKRLPTYRLIARLGLSDYDVPAPIDGHFLDTDQVTIPLKMHIGAPSVPIVRKGQRVKKEELIADIPEGSLGAKIHASISGVISDITDTGIHITKE
ncbi:NADH dehydrogenase [Clostridia bacterium]|nr:NADH dehydrogenase [Clostridia bacterium]